MAEIGRVLKAYDQIHCLKNYGRILSSIEASDVNEEYNVGLGQLRKSNLCYTIRKFSF